MNGAPADLAKSCRQAQLVGGALVGSIVVDAVIVELIRATRAPFGGFAPHAPVDTLRMVFIVLAVADLVVIRFVRTQMLAAPARGVVPSSTRPRTPGACLQSALSSGHCAWRWPGQW